MRAVSVNMLEIPIFMRFFEDFMLFRSIKIPRFFMRGSFVFMRAIVDNMRVGLTICG